MTNLPIADEVAGILGWWLPRVQDVLGANVQSVMLFGGVTLFADQPADVIHHLLGPLKPCPSRRITLVRRFDSSHSLVSWTISLSFSIHSI